MGNLIDLRKQHKDEFEKKHGVKLGFMSAFVLAATAALKEVCAHFQLKAHICSGFHPPVHILLSLVIRYRYFFINPLCTCPCLPTLTCAYNPFSGARDQRDHRRRDPRDRVQGLLRRVGGGGLPQRARGARAARHPKYVLQGLVGVL